jgi:mRNA-degrading endonuclease RelE of RelBE toxin-antitoxin system
MPLVGFLWDPEALERLAEIPGKQRAQIIKKARALMMDSHPPGTKKLSGMEGEDGVPLYRQRSGDYRILYEVRTKPHTIIVIRDVDDRKDVYR